MSAFSSQGVGLRARRALLFLLLLSCDSGAEEGAAGASSEKEPVAVVRASLEDAIEIDTCAELQAMENDLDANYVLIADVNCAGFDAGDGGGFRPIVGSPEGWNPFQGHFDGQGHVIRNLSIDRPSGDSQALFGIIQYGSIRNVGLENVSIKGDYGVGSLAASAYGTEITDVYATGFVSGRLAGGLIGSFKETSLISDSYSSVALHCTNDPCGLLFGHVWDGTITRTYSRGTSSNDVGTASHLIGSQEAGEWMTSSFFDCTLAGNCSETGARPSTTLKTSAHYDTAGWDLEEVWKFDSSGTYPCLAWQSSCGTTADSDSDGTLNGADGCPTDPLKTAPGGCGCHLDESCLPTEIDTCAELQAMNNDRAEDYVLTADVDCQGFDSGDGHGFMPIGVSETGWDPFVGTFDGGGHVIRNLTIDREENHQALFGITFDADIRNVGLEDVDIAGMHGNAALVGFSLWTRISQVYATGTVQGYESVGGLVGSLKDDSTLSDSYSSVDVESEEPCGLIVGTVQNSGTSITRTYSSGDTVDCDALAVGSILEDAVVSSSYFDCTVAGNCTAVGAQTTTTLQTQSHYATDGWDFTDVWAIDAPSTYPCLRWQDGCGDGPPVCDPSDATCDGEDDDCDENVDENYASTSTTCGVGACASTGSTSCVSGSVQNSCTPGTPGPTDATCNGVDENCNGATDESYASTPTTCGVGACAANGSTSCVNGSVQNSCTPRPPAASDATCNGFDDDCNGTRDEDYVIIPTSCGVGACAANGMSSCVNGAVQSNCVPGAPTADANCNGLDEDCDGTADDNYIATPSTCTVAGCDATGQVVCTAGGLQDTCLTSPTCVAEVACNDNQDNDGDADVDCADSDCASSCSGEICTNTLDDDGDLLFDCADPDCVSEPACTDLPPRAADVAPPLPRGVSVSLYDSTRFLYAGPSPVQKFMDPETIVEDRTVLVTGRVLNQSGAALPGVTVRVLNHEELGESTSDIDGNFFMVVNGGGELTLQYELLAHPSVQRVVRSDWNDQVVLEDVVMTPLDPVYTAVSLDGTTQGMQVARGSVITDADGSRQATVLLPAGVEAQMRMPGGALVPFTGGSLRVTEYTVGPNGLKAMVATLPSNTVYTYAAEFSFDEAVDAGAESVEFSAPVITYVDNFIDAPVGTAVPVGYYDRTGSRMAFSDSGWAPEPNGLVIRVLGVQSGLATLDLTGSGQPASAMELAARNITTAEQAQLATLYQPGQSLWRVPRQHFSPCDYNWVNNIQNQWPEADVKQNEKTKSRCPEDATGSRIGCLSQTLGEAIAIPGTPYSLRYESDKHAVDDLSVDVAIGSLRSEFKSLRVQLIVAGRSIEHTLPLQPYQTFTFDYDGKDVFGRDIFGTREAGVRVCAGVDWNAIAPPSSDIQRWWLSTAADAGTPVSLIPRGGLTEICRDFDTSVTRSIEGPVGGWDVDVHHFLDPEGRRVYKGDGRIQKADGLHPLTTLVAGRGRPGWTYCRTVWGFTDQQCGIGETRNPLGAHVWRPHQVVSAPDGTVYVADDDGRNTAGGPSYVLRIDPQGGSERIFGFLPNGTNTTPGTLITLTRITGMDMGPDGFLYVAVLSELSQNTFGYWSGIRIYRVATDGSSATVVAGSLTGSSADNIPATSAFLGADGQSGNIAFGPNGSLFVGESHRVREIGPDGIINTAAGLSTRSSSGNPMTVPMDLYLGPVTNPRSARTVDFGTYVNDIDISDEGEIFIASVGGIYVVGVDGNIRLFAGGSSWYGPAQSDRAVPSNLSFVRLVVEHGDEPRVFARATDLRVIEISDGRMFEVGSLGTLPPTFEYVPGQTARRAIASVRALELDADGNLLIGNDGTYRVIKLWHHGVPTRDTIVSEDGSQLWEFDGNRHVRTRDAILGTTLYSFGYSPTGQLTSISDRYGSLTTIVRDSSERPTAIVPPQAPQTLLSTDSLGRLSATEDPEGGRYELTYDGTSRRLATFEQPTGATSSFEYDAEGLLTSDTDAEGNEQTLVRTVTRTEAPRGTIVETVRTEPGVGNATVYFEDVTNANYSFVEVTEPSGFVRTTRSEGADLVTFESSDDTFVRVENSIDPRLGTYYPYRTTTWLPSGLAKVVTELRTATVADVSNPLSVTQTSFQVTTSGRGTATTVFDVPSRTVSYTSAVGRELQMILDTMGRPISISVPGLHTITRHYDARGRLDSVAAGVSNQTRATAYSYDAITGYPLSSVGPEPSEQVSIETDLLGRIGSSTANGRVTSFTYDGAGRVETVVVPTGNQHAITYGPRGQVASYTAPTVVTGQSSTTNYLYRANRALAQRIGPDGTETQLTYDANTGLLAEVSTGDRDLFYTYETNSDKIAEVRVVENDSEHALGYEYDGPLLVAETWSDESETTEWTVSRSYDQAFDITRFDINDEQVVAYSYDFDGLIVAANGLVLSRDLDNGSLLSTVYGAMTTAHSYNGFGEQASLSAVLSGQEVFEQTIFQRDLSGRIVSAEERVHPQSMPIAKSYAYDDAGRLVSVQHDGVVISAYGYDENGNRLSRSTAAGTVIGRYDQQDRLLRYCPEDAQGLPVPAPGLPCFEYGYDARGRLRSMLDLAQSTTKALVYDESGSLKNVDLPNGQTIRYQNDAIGRRIGKRVNGVKQWGMLYRDDLRPIAMTDGSDQIISTFVYASRRRVPDLIEREGEVYRIVADQLGSVRLVVNVATGAITQRLDYDEFGRIVGDTNPGWQPFGFAGGIYDADTGLVRFGAREYDPVSGRWTTKDPTLFAGGDTNLYAYCFNDPVNWIDPSGEVAIADDLAIAGVALAATALATWCVAGGCEAVSESLDDLGDAIGDAWDDLVNMAKQTGKEKATDVPSWAKGNKPLPGESGKDFADRLCKEKYGPEGYPKGPGSEFSKIQKWGDRGFGSK